MLSDPVDFFSSMSFRIDQILEGVNLSKLDKTTLLPLNGGVSILLATGVNFSASFEATVVKWVFKVSASRVDSSIRSFFLLCPKFNLSILDLLTSSDKYDLFYLFTRFLI